LRERANYQPTTPGFSEGRAINTPTRAYIGEAGPEVLFPVGKIGEAINAVYREGGSAMVGATLAFLHASPRSTTNSALLSEAGRLKQQFGVSGDFAQIQGIGHYDVKPIPSLEESINNQSSSGETTTQSQSIVQQFLNFGGGIVNSVLGIAPANAQQFNGAFLRGDLANTQVQNEITAKGLYLGAGKKKDGATGHQHIGISSRVFGTKDGVGSGASAAGHGGIDIGTSYQKGYYVSFGMSGKVVFAGPQGGYGNLVIIESGGHDYYFGHLANISSGLTVGQPYTGQTIGEIGNTGNSYGEHLHFEKRTAGGGTGTRMNPAAELGALSIGRRTKATAPANKPVKPADPSAANKTVTTAPVTQTGKNGEAASTQVPVPIPVPQVVKQMVPVPIKEAVKALPFVVDIFGKGGGRK
jgi:murein DD-endopeptidase MepM/ murein hydrolase activator NlpD